MPSLLADRAVRNVAAGFLLTGMLMGMLGSLIIVWRYQLDRDPRAIGLHFFAFDAALLLGGFSSQMLASRVSLRSLAVFSCLLASAGLCGLAFLPPPALVLWRMLGVALLGASAGGLLIPLLYFIRPHYQEDALSTINLAGLTFGLGSLLVTIVLGCVSGMELTPWQILPLAAIPLAVIPYIGRIPFSRSEPTERPADLRTHFQDVQSLTAVLLSLLLFFQFGNEWALAGWLSLFLVRRLGLSPSSAIFILALYFFALVTGRLISQRLRRSISHAKLLFVSVTVSMLGYLLVSLTASTEGAALATLVIGFGFAPIYGLVAEKIGRRFDYVPGFFNSIFSLAITGAMLVPWLLGFVGYYLGMQYVLIVPAFGSVAVLVLMLTITLEAKLMSGDERPSNPPAQAPKALATSAGRKK